MSFLTVSYIALWVIVVLLCLAVAALTKQISLLYGRLPRTGARTGNVGPEIGKTIKPFVQNDVYGKAVYIPDPNGRQTLIVFISQNCPNCEELAPALQGISKQEKNLRLILMAFKNDEASNRKYAEERGLSDIQLVASWECGVHFQVLMSPYAILLGGDGTVLSKGLVNNREHLDSILNAADSGYPTIQTMMVEKSPQVNNDATSGRGLQETPVQKG
jgi:methylamine dehydrogenase accessory protein MauD